jgi:hypothetical protein
MPGFVGSTIKLIQADIDDMSQFDRLFFDFGRDKKDCWSHKLYISVYCMPDQYSDVLLAGTP